MAQKKKNNRKHATPAWGKKQQKELRYVWRIWAGSGVLSVALIATPLLVVVAGLLVAVGMIWQSYRKNDWQLAALAVVAMVAVAACILLHLAYLSVATFVLLSVFLLAHYRK